MKKISEPEGSSFLTKTQLRIILICLGLTLLFIYALAWFYSVTAPERVGTYGFNLQLSEWVIMIYDFCLFMLSTITAFTLLPLGAVTFFVSLRKPTLRKRALIFFAIGLGSLIVRLYLLPLIL